MKKETGTSQKPAPVQSDTNIRNNSDITSVYILAVLVLIETLLLL